MLLSGLVLLATPVAVPPLREDAADPAQVAQAELPPPADDAPKPADSPGFADSLGLKTSERIGLWTHDRDLDGETAVPVAGLRARLAPRVGALAGRAEGYVQIDRVRGVRADLAEGWLGVSLGNLEARVGRQIVVWGRADRLNPTDNLSGRNYTLLLASDEEQRLGPGMVQMRWGRRAWTLDAYWIPEFRPNIFPVDRPPPGVALLPDRKRNRAGQFAFKVDYSSGKVDGSVSWFHGIDRTRDVHPAPPPPGYLLGIEQRYADIDAYGGDLAGAVGPLGWRVEAAYTHVERAPLDPFTKRSNFWMVGGIDLGLGNGSNLNLQYSVRRIFDYSDPRRLPDPAQRAIASLSATVNNQLDRVQNGATLRLARSFFNDTLQTEISAIHTFETRDTAIRPKLGYAISDRLHLAVGADIFAGPSLSYFGRVRSLSSGWLQLARGF
jgi:hypothetical protein